MSPSSFSSALSQWSVRRIILTTLVVVAVALGFWLLYQLQLAIYILLTAIIIGVALKPLTDKFSEWGLPPLISGILIYAFALVLLIAFVFLMTPLLFEQISAIINTIPGYYHSFRTSLIESPNLFLQQISWRLPQELLLANFSKGPESTDMLSVTQTLNTVSLALKGFFITLATLMLSLYWTLDSERAIHSVLLLLPSQHREAAQTLINEMEDKVGAYVRGQAILCAVIGLLALIAYLIIGVPYAIVLALFAGLLEAVPYVGPTLGAIPALLMAASVDPQKAIWVIVATIIIQQLENTLFVPRIMKKAVGVNSFVALLAIFTFGTLGGILGVLLAIPIAAILQLMLDRFLLQANRADEQNDNGRDNFSRLRYYTQDLIQDIRKQFWQQEELLPMANNHKLIEEDLEAIATDLDSILAQALAPEGNL